jgi:hypothetical protein
MKSATIIIISLSLCAMSFACSPNEEQQFAAKNPQLAPATQALESVQKKLDLIADSARQAAGVVQNAASDAAGLGMPGAGGIAVIAGLIGTILGVYKERRTSTTPLRTAFEQVVQSVEEAFPVKTEQQKSALAAVQDRATRSLVATVKTA